MRQASTEVRCHRLSAKMLRPLLVQRRQTERKIARRHLPGRFKFGLFRPLCNDMLLRSPSPARRAAGFIEPCLSTLGDTLPAGPQWAYEIKHDDFRLICHRDGDRVRHCFPGAARAPPVP